MRDHETKNKLYYDAYWRSGLALYESHPTSRHRRRFVAESLRQASAGLSHPRVYDYGCGTGAVLREAQGLLGLENTQLGGCDISAEALRLAREQFPGGAFHEAPPPRLAEPADIVVCSEVIEHTPDYRDILNWIHENLRPGGWLILTTPHTPMDPPDISYGHVQHFELGDLTACLHEIGFETPLARRWGYPLFTLQKAVTKRFFRQIEKRVISKPLGPGKRLLFALVYGVYHVHGLIPWGPQIFIRARKP